MISIPKTELDALRGAGTTCRVNGDPVTMRLVNGFLCYHGEGQDHRCKVLMMDQQPNGDVAFMAASHGEDDEQHSIIGAEEDGQAADLMAVRPDGMEAH
jgi:hypothetical protein